MRINLALKNPVCILGMIDYVPTTEYPQEVLKEKADAIARDGSAAGGSAAPCAEFQTTQNGGTAMKKVISTLLIIAMIGIALTGCSGGGSKLTGA